MNVIKRPRVRGGRGKFKGTGPVAIVVGMAVLFGTLGFGAGAAGHRAEGATVPFRPETVQVAEPAAEGVASYGGLACGVNLDCSELDQRRAASAAAKAPASKASDQPSVTRRVTVSQGKNGRTLTESTTVRTAHGSTTVTIRRGPTGATVTRSTTSR